MIDSTAFKTNVYSAYYVAAAFLPLMKAAKADEFGVPNCSIINISSISAFIKYSQNGQYSYNASKAAIRHLSNLMAFEFSRDDILIRVNDICPGCALIHHCLPPSSRVPSDVPWALSCHSWFPSQMTTGAPDEKGASAPMVEGMRDKNRVPAGRVRPSAYLPSVALALAVADLAVDRMRHRSRATTTRWAASCSTSPQTATSGVSISRLTVASSLAGPASRSSPACMQLGDYIQLRLVCMRSA